MSKKTEATCDRCGKGPLASKDWHDGSIRVGAWSEKGINYGDIDLCNDCFGALKRGVDAFMQGAVVTVKVPGGNS